MRETKDDKRQVVFVVLEHAADGQAARVHGVYKYKHHAKTASDKLDPNSKGHMSVLGFKVHE